MTPSDQFFNNDAWSKFGDWKQNLSPYYKKAKMMLGTTPNDRFSKADNALKELAKRLW